MKMTNEYEKQANDFLKSTDSKLSFVFNGLTNRFDPTNEDITEKTFEFAWILKKGGRELSGLFNCSIRDTRKILRKTVPSLDWSINKKLLAKGNKYEIRQVYSHALNVLEKQPNRFKGKILKDFQPSNYDLLACLQAHEVEEDLQDFMLEFGYEVDQLTHAMKIHKACLSEYIGLLKMYDTKELEALNEIL